MIINQIKEELEVLESLEFKKVDKHQRKMIKDYYNFYTGEFEYSEDEWGNLVLICAKDDFRNIEYYIGLEYDKESIEYKFLLNNKIIVSYCGSERAEDLLARLQKLEG